MELPEKDKRFLPVKRLNMEKTKENIQRQQQGGKVYPRGKIPIVQRTVGHYNENVMKCV